MHRAIGFEGRTIEEPYDKYIGEWVFVIKPNNSSIGGCVKEVKDGSVILNPYQSLLFTDKKMTSYLVEGELHIHERSIEYIVPSTRENIQNNCKYSTHKQEVQDAKTNDNPQTKLQTQEQISTKNISNQLDFFEN